MGKKRNPEKFKTEKTEFRKNILYGIWEKI